MKDLKVAIIHNIYELNDMEQAQPSTFKVYALSSLITFLSVFSLTFVTQYGIYDPASMSQQAGVALILTAVRAGVKALIEYISMKVTSKYVQ